jgi:hypothetical protein
MNAAETNFSSVSIDMKDHLNLRDSFPAVLLFCLLRTQASQTPRYGELNTYLS